MALRYTDLIMPPTDEEKGKTPKKTTTRKPKETKDKPKKDKKDKK